MYVTLNRADGKIWFTYYDGHCGYCMDDNEQNQELLNFPPHLKFKNKVNLDDDFMRNFWKIVEGNPGRLRLVTNALIDIKKGIRGVRKVLDDGKVISLYKFGDDYAMYVDGEVMLNRNFKDLLSELHEDESK